jgi:copper chaperone
LSEVIIKVEGMGCQSCVSAVEKAVRSVAPGATVEVTLAEGLVRIGEGGASREILAAAITRAGYDVISG